MQPDLRPWLARHLGTRFCDAWGNITSSTGTMAAVNPLRYRGYYFDSETGFYYLMSRYYDPENGRFINADGLVSTGQGLLGNNMFAYCNNNPLNRTDAIGFFSQCSITSSNLDYGSRTLIDYIIYYFHPESTQNLDQPAISNHSTQGTRYISVSSFGELSRAINNAPGNTDDIYIYIHGDDRNLCFYYAQYYSAQNIEDSVNQISIAGDIFLFSCKGGRGELASAMARASNCEVIACEYKVSFGDGYARCGWRNFIENSSQYGNYAWYRFSPDGNKTMYEQYFVYTQ